MFALQIYIDLFFCLHASTFVFIYIFFNYSVEYYLSCFISCNTVYLLDIYVEFPILIFPSLFTACSVIMIIIINPCPLWRNVKKHVYKIKCYVGTLFIDCKAHKTYSACSLNKGRFLISGLAP